MNERDARIIQRILDCVREARSGAVGLNATADAILFLSASISLFDEDWSDLIASNAATLESAGLANPEQVAQMGGRLDAVVGDALDAIEASAIARLTKTPPAGGSGAN